MSNLKEDDSKELIVVQNRAHDLYRKARKELVGGLGIEGFEAGESGLHLKGYRLYTSNTWANGSMFWQQEFVGDIFLNDVSLFRLHVVGCISISDLHEHLNLIEDLIEELREAVHQATEKFRISK